MAGRSTKRSRSGQSGCRRVVLHDPREQHVRRAAPAPSACPGARVRLLHRVHRQPADHVDRRCSSLRIAIGRSPSPASPSLRSDPAASLRPSGVRRVPLGSHADATSRQAARITAEDGEAGGEAVQEVAAADRADLAGAERARERQRAEQLVDDAGVVVGRAEEVPTAPVAGEQRARRAASLGRRATRAGPRRPRAASRTWNCTVWPTSTSSPTASAPVSLIGAEHVAHEEVAALEVGRCSSTTRPRCSPCTDQLAVVVARLGRAVLEPRHRGLAGELVDEVPLARG